MTKEFLNHGEEHGLLGDLIKGLKPLMRKRYVDTLTLSNNFRYAVDAPPSKFIQI